MLKRRNRLSICIALLILAAPVAWAQPNNPPAPPNPNDPNLAPLLAQWEKDTSTMQSLVIEFTCQRTNAAAKITKELVGSVKCMKLPDGNVGAVVQLDAPPQQGQPGRTVEKYICTGTHIYNVWPEDKTIHVYTLPPRQAGQLPDDGPLPFLTGMKAEVARRRYQLALSEPDKEDVKPWYLYVHVKPNFDRDLQDFNYARVVVMRKDSPQIPLGMPKELYWVEPNKNETKWKISRVLRNVPNSVDRREFVKPDTPPGWKLENINRVAGGAPAGSGPPRVIRNQDQ